MTGDARPLGRDLVKLVAPPLAGAAGLALLGRATQAYVLVGLAAVVAHLRLLAPQVLVRVERAARAAVHALGRGIHLVAGSAVFVLFVVPGWALARLRRRPAFDDHGWEDRPPSSATKAFDRRPFDLTERQARPPGRVAWACTAIGAVALLLAADLAVGSAWRWARGPEDDGGGETTSAVQVDVVDLHDASAARRSIEAQPWGAAYVRSLGKLGFDYWPYLQLRTRPLDEPGLHTDGWVRRSVAAPETAGTVPTVWFFGGSVMWGLGQRDQHTIASEVATLAAADGLAIDARNFGQPAWVTQQEVDLFAALLDGKRATPALAVFLDGPNDVAAQAQPLADGHGPRTPLPVHLGMDQAIAMSEAASTRQAAPAPESLAAEVRHAYARNSLVVQGWRAIAGEPAGAEEAKACSICPSLWGVERIDAAAVERATVVYRNQRGRASAIAARSDVATAFLWQPTDRDVPAVRDAAAAVGEPTVDLSAALDHDRGRYLDGVHLDEAGAKLVAARIYREIRPQLQRWYQTHS